MNALFTPQLHPQQLIREHFAATRCFYRWVWRIRQHLGMHVGFDGRKPGTFAESVAAMNDLLADAAGIAEHDHVLDAGCGVGGSAIALSRSRNANVTGIDLCDFHIAQARATAERLQLAGAVSFVEGDYHAVPFENAKFDAAWALESLCYSHDKPAFFSEMHRCLRPGGRLVFADAFLSRTPNGRDARLADSFRDGWATASIVTANELPGLLRQAGFVVREVRDLSSFVGRSSQRMFVSGRLFAPLRFALRRLGLRGKLRAKAIDAAISQREAYRRGLGVYLLVVAEKL